MHVFHIRGLSGLLLLIAAILAILTFLTIVPATFMMVAWNAMVHEWFGGPAIALYQGFLLWGFMLVSLKLLLQPEFRIEYQCMGAHKASSDPEPEQLLSDDPELMDGRPGE